MTFISSHKAAVFFAKADVYIVAAMCLLPICCFNCGSVLAGKWLRYQELVLNYNEEEN